MSKITLLNGILKDSDEVLGCFNPAELRFDKGEIMTDFSGAAAGEKIYILTQGRAHLAALDPEGHSNIIETYEENDIYGRIFLNPYPGMDFIITAAEPCRTIQLDYGLLSRCCENHCPHHGELLGNLFRISVHKGKQLTAHLSILSGRTIRAKLLSFLKYYSEGKREFTLPYKMSELADYLCVDRCAMLRELKNMREEGLIDSKGRHFYLY